jgi:BolA protein
MSKNHSINSQAPHSLDDAGSLIALVTQALTDELSPSFLEVINESDDHVGHGASGAHLHVKISSPLFIGDKPIAVHRKIYGVLQPWLSKDIHALRITIV